MSDGRGAAATVAEWYTLDAADSVAARSLADELEAASARLHTASFALDGPPLTAARVDDLAATLARLDGTYRFRARIQAPMEASRIRALHRAGFVDLELDPGAPWSATLATVRRCDALGVVVRYSLPCRSPVALLRSIPALVHLTPPEHDGPHEPGSTLALALAHWRAVHGHGLLTWRRGPRVLRLADSRRMAWCGHESGARPRIVTLRDEDTAVYDLCEQPRTPDEIVQALSPLPRERLGSLLATLVSLRLLLPIGDDAQAPLRLLAMATAAPAWWERDAVDARLPPEGLVPADSKIWQALLHEQPWAFAPERPRHLHLHLATEPGP
jgi:hypothetical protein